jgi:hypothetical protein
VYSCYTFLIDCKNKINGGEEGKRGDVFKIILTKGGGFKAKFYLGLDI